MTTARTMSTSPSSGEAQPAIGIRTKRSLIAEGMKQVHLAGRGGAASFTAIEVGFAQATERVTPRLRAAQRVVISLVGIDLIIGLAVMATTVLIRPDSSANAGIALWLTIWVLCSASLGGYSSCRDMSTRPALSLRTGIAAMAASILVSTLPTLPFQVRPAEIAIVVGVFTICGVVGRRVFTRLAPPRVVVVTGTDKALPEDWDSNRVVRFLQISEELASDPDRLVSELREAVRSTDATAVEVLSNVHLPEWLFRHLSWELREERVNFRFVIMSGRMRAGRVHSSVGHDHAVLEITPPVQPWPARAAKRLIDIIGSSILIVIASPVLLLVAVLVKSSSRGPVLYHQERVGLNGALFNIFKFRSMSDGADTQLQELLKAQQRDGTPLFKVHQDPRITRVGAMLRRYSIDELPQLFNVFGGSMSLVGPRPQRPSEVALYRGEAGHRLGVMPGMTGLWQVSGRSRLSWEESQKLDVDYAHNWSIQQDVQILAKTARAVIGADGAY